ncbi:hypothetical protein UF38_00120, partial [Vibrio parahaemolyticus]
GAERQPDGDGDRDDVEGEAEDADARIEQQIGGEDAGNGAGGADQRGLRAGIDEEMHRSAEQAADQIEGEEADMAHGVLDIVGEDPKEQHVADEMHPAAMHEHVGEPGGPGGHHLKVGRQHGPVGEDRRDEA